MKTSILLVFLAAAFCSCKQIGLHTADSGKPIFDTTSLPKPSLQYHLKVKCFAGDSYIIVYTNDNWDTEKRIMTTFDRSSEVWGNSVIYQEEIFGSWDADNKQKAIDFAKTLKTYSDCERYNAKVFRDYNRLLNYRKAHPIAKRPEEKPKEVECCKETKIY